MWHYLLSANCLYFIKLWLIWVVIWMSSYSFFKWVQEERISTTRLSNILLSAASTEILFLHTVVSCWGLSWNQQFSLHPVPVIISSMTAHNEPQLPVELSSMTNPWRPSTKFEHQLPQIFHYTIQSPFSTVLPLSLKSRILLGTSLLCILCKCPVTSKAGKISYVPYSPFSLHLHWIPSFQRYTAVIHLNALSPSFTSVYHNGSNMGFEHTNLRCMSKQSSFDLQEMDLNASCISSWPESFWFSMDI